MQRRADKAVQEATKGKDDEILRLKAQLETQAQEITRLKAQSLKKDEEIKRLEDLCEWEKKRRLQCEGDLELWRSDCKAVQGKRQYFGSGGRGWLSIVD